MRSTSFLWILILLLLLLDLYTFQAVKAISATASPRGRLWTTLGYWSLSGATILLLALTPLLHVSQWPRHLANYIYALVLGLLFAKILASLFFLADDLRRGLVWIFQKFSARQGPADPGSSTGIPRSVFLSWLGLGLGGGLFSTLVYGFSNKYNYRVVRQKLSLQRLPAAFRGLKIVHISDIHSGSFTDPGAVARGIDLILAQQADLILFTGDLVNDRASEMQDYQHIFSRLQAPLGVYSTLGNHDYGDYTEWPSPQAKVQNLEHLKSVHANMGWKLLMNEHVVLEKDGAQIALLGIENWSAKARFPKKGRMKDAYVGAESYPFKILMSHDPSHWDAEVIPKYGDIDLTLSGHTHGMQFGVELPFFRWSPVQYVYKQWAGLYKQGNQHLYVNRGFGFLGYPGRIGILPEITVLELS